MFAALTLLQYLLRLLVILHATAPSQRSKTLLNALLGAPTLLVAGPVLNKAMAAMSGLRFCML